MDVMTRIGRPAPPGGRRASRLSRLARVGLAGCLLGLVVAPPGCSSSRKPESHGHAGAVLGEVTKAYVGYMRAHGFQPPASEAQFKTVLAELGTTALKRAGVHSVDELLVSPRDSQPFVVEYGKNAKKYLDRGIVAFEQVGKDGRRLVGYDLGYVADVDQQAFDQLLAAQPR